MKIRIFGLVLLTMILVEQPPVQSEARTIIHTEIKKTIVKLPLVDTVNALSIQIEMMKEMNSKYLQVLRGQQKLLNELNN